MLESVKAKPEDHDEVTEMSTLFSLYLQAAQPERTTVSKGRGHWEVIRGLIKLGKGRVLPELNVLESRRKTFLCCVIYTKVLDAAVLQLLVLQVNY